MSRPLGSLLLALALGCARRSTPLSADGGEPSDGNGSGASSDAGPVTTGGGPVTPDAGPVTPDAGPAAADGGFGIPPDVARTARWFMWMRMPGMWPLYAFVGLRSYLMSMHITRPLIIATAAA